MERSTFSSQSFVLLVKNVSVCLQAAETGDLEEVPEDMTESNTEAPPAAAPSTSSEKPAAAAPPEKMAKSTGTGNVAACKSRTRTSRTPSFISKLATIFPTCSHFVQQSKWDEIAPLTVMSAEIKIVPH